MAPNRSLRHWGSATFRRLAHPTTTLLLADALAALLSFYLAVGIRFGFDRQLIAEAFDPLLPRALVYTAFVLVGLLTMGLYRPRQRPRGAETAVRVGLGIFLAGIGNALLFYVFPMLEIWRGPMALAMVISCLTVFPAHLVVLRILDSNPIKRRVLVVGVGDAALRIRRLRRRADRRRFDVVAFVAMTAEEEQRAREQAMTPVVSAAAARRIPALDEIVVALDDRRGILPLDFLLEQKQRGVAITDLVDFLERETERLDLDVLRPSWLLYEKSSQSDVLYGWLKRLFDIVFASLLLVLTLPALLLTVLAIRMESPPGVGVFYKQRRVGRNGREFELLKFRSMRVDAEVDTGPRFASTNDSRVTAVGRLIRRFRIDELPQLLNIIRGDMSVVGPRPERPEFVEELAKVEPLYFYRHGVRPGLTGWAQLNFPYGASLDDAREKLTFDLYYIKNTNLVMDLLILLQTLEVVVWGRGTSMAGSRARGSGSAGDRGRAAAMEQESVDDSGVSGMRPTLEVSQAGKRDAA